MIHKKKKTIAALFKEVATKYHFDSSAHIDRYTLDGGGNKIKQTYSGCWRITRVAHVRGMPGFCAGMVVHGVRLNVTLNDAKAMIYAAKRTYGVRYIYWQSTTKENNLRRYFKQLAKNYTGIKIVINTMPVKNYNSGAKVTSMIIQITYNHRAQR